MRFHIVLFACGTWLLQNQAELPDMRLAFALALCAPAWWLAQARCRALAWAGIAVLMGGALAGGFFWAAGMAHLRLADALPHDWEGRDIEVIGVVAGLPQTFERSVRFEFRVEQVLTPGARVPGLIVLAWWGRGGALPEVHAGERWRHTVRLKRPHGYANPHGYDYEAWLLERGVRATGYVRPGTAAQRLAPLVHRPAYWVEALRERLRVRILEALAGRSHAGVIVALVVGDQRAIPPAQWQTFTRTGVNHLMSISGLHVTMVSGLAYGAVLLLWRRSARLALKLPAARAAAAAAVIAAFLYTLLAGFAVPAQRTLYMVCVVAVALWMDRTLAPSVVLAAALLVVLLVDPWAVTAAGFWLSFGAVAAILFVMANRVRQPNWAVGWMRTQAAVTLALMPLLLALFQQVSMVSPLANAFAIPVVGLAVVPLSLLGAVLPFDAVLKLAELVMGLCTHALAALSAAPVAVWQQHAPAGWAVAAALAGALWLMLPRGFPARWLGVLACLPLFFVFPAAPRWGDVRMSVLDVGQGLAVVVQTAQHALLYDTGPAFGPAADSGNRVIAPYLRAAGVRRLDALVLSHDDSDHTGGALSVLQALPVAWLLSTLPDMDPLPLVAEAATQCYAGQAWEWDGVRFEVLHPPRASYDARMRSNDRGCVLKVTAAGGTVLLPADVERRSEQALLASGATLAADVLVAGHHGSRTSSTPAFVEAVSPRAVIFPVGYRNRFGHPHQDVVARFAERGAALYRTDRDGAVLVNVVAGRAIEIGRYRALRQRYWHEAWAPAPGPWATLPP